MPETEQEAPSQKKDALDLSQLKDLNIQALNSMARTLGVEGAAGMK